MLIGTLFPGFSGLFFCFFSLLPCLCFSASELFVSVNSMDTLADDLSKGRMGALLADPASACMADHVLAAANCQLPRQNCRIMELSDPLRYFGISRSLLPSSIFPRWGRHIGPLGVRTPSRQEAWGWIYRQFWGKTESAYWQQLAHLDELRDISAELLRGGSEREYRPYTHPEMAGALAQVFNMAVYRRMEHHGWTLDVPEIADARTQAYCQAI